jgi:hypothetical protein
MAIVRLPIVDLGTINSSGQFVQSKVVTGGLVAFIVAVSGTPYRLIGFSIGMYPSGGSGGAGLSTWTDGKMKVPLQITVPPNYSPLAKGELEVMFVNTATPPTIALATGIIGYAELHGVIYPNVSQIFILVNLPNTTSFQLGTTNTAALIVEDYQEGDHEWRV